MVHPSCACFIKPTLWWRACAYGDTCLDFQGPHLDPGWSQETFGPDSVTARIRFILSTSPRSALQRRELEPREVKGLVMSLTKEKLLRWGVSQQRGSEAWVLPPESCFIRTILHQPQFPDARSSASKVCSFALSSFAFTLPFPLSSGKQSFGVG